LPVAPIDRRARDSGARRRSLNHAQLRNVSRTPPLVCARPDGEKPRQSGLEGNTMGIWQIVEWLVLGAVAGFIASKVINKTGEGLMMDIVLGIVGAFVGGFISSHFFGGIGTGANIISIPTLIVAVLGAIVVLLIYRLVFRRNA
jgi:uncharacterized membrane protein YeaQ/YmgE (transglycosylase-associated protein family)